MALPTFLGIGAPRAGTTWLHTLLAGHPDIYMPTRRKEVRFFERYYDRGLPWYEPFFCRDEDAGRYRAIGEISTQYYDCAPCPERISAVLPDAKLIMMLRHPVSRAYSQYGFRVQRSNYRGSFEQFLAACPKALEKGYYSRYLARYLRHFDRSRILCLLFEQVFADTRKAEAAVAQFLGVPVDGFASCSAARRVNPSSLPRFQYLYGVCVRAGRRLRRHRCERLVDFVKKSAIERMLTSGRKLPPLSEDLKARLASRYREEFDELEQCLQLDLGCWRNGEQVAGG